MRTTLSQGCLGLCLILFFSYISISHANDGVSVDILDVTDRGSVTDTPYVVPNQSLLIEGGYQYIFSKIDGSLYSAPQTELALGVNFNSEIFVLLPTYVSQRKTFSSGFDTPSLGVKHEWIHRDHWVSSWQGILTLSGGSDAFGHQGAGGQCNLLTTYSMSPMFDLSSMLGISTSTESRSAMGGRFQSFNSSIAVSFKPIETMSFFVEMFGQTKSGYFVGSTLGADVGVLYQIARNASLDVEFAKNISSSMLYYNYYLGSGISILF